MKPDLSKVWKISAADPGSNVGLHAWSEDEALDFCGRLLYANTLFEVINLTIQRADSRSKVDWASQTKTISWGIQWVVRIPHETGRDGYREIQLKSKHELLGTILAELRKGAFHIDVRNILNAPTEDIQLPPE